VRVALLACRPREGLRKLPEPLYPDRPAYIWAGEFDLVR
jgi:hypothetical protein